jgi:hypothetical protein
VKTQQVKEVVEIALVNPKVAYLLATMTAVETWWLDWGSPLIDASASILGVVLLIVMIRKNWNTGSGLEK